MSRCEGKAEKFLLDCTYDVAHLMSAAVYDTFKNAIGQNECFAAEGSSVQQSGHSCMQALRNAALQTGIDVEITLATEWRPLHNFRWDANVNPLASIHNMKRFDKYPGSAQEGQVKQLASITEPESPDRAEDVQI